MLDKKRNDVVNMHFKLSQTLKELKTILPSGFLKTNIFSSSIIPIKHQSTLINLKKGKKIKDSNSKETPKNNSNNIYTFSEGNEGNKNSKKILSNLKNYFAFNKPLKKIHSFKSNNNFSDNENSTPIIRQIVKIPKLKYDFRYISVLRNKYKTKSNSKLNLHNIKLNYEFNKTRKNFKSTSIDNSMMKSNIFLPSLTKRLQSNLPRYEREEFGLLLKNSRINYTNHFNHFHKVNKNIIEKGIDEYKKYKVIKFNKGLNVNIKKKKYNSERKEMFVSNSFLNKIKMEDVVEIKSIKKLKKEVN
jgi:hypothetical protein